MVVASSLRPEHLQSFWYSASKYNFTLVGTFISLLWATATDKEEADMYRKCLDEYRWVLRLSSKSAEFLERAMGMLAVSTGVLIGAILERVDGEGGLIRGSRGARRSSAGCVDASGHENHVHPIMYRSESEMHDETRENGMWTRHGSVR
jgi:hypothetical protein